MCVCVWGGGGVAVGRNGVMLNGRHYTVLRYAEHLEVRDFIESGSRKCASAGAKQPF